MVGLRLMFVLRGASCGQQVLSLGSPPSWDARAKKEE
mgnify:CR=1 FL=1|jgi:hypothetical protein